LDLEGKRYVTIEFRDDQLRKWEHFVSNEDHIFTIIKAAKDIALGLRYMHVHRSRLIHRDLHTENIMVR